MDLMKSITQEYEKTEIPAFGVGDTVKVHIKIKEGNRERIQVFEGFVLKRQNGGISETFTVRKLSSGIGVEKTFPLHSPKIEKIEVVRRGAVRRAKLNYMRERTGKAAKIKTKEYGLYKLTVPSAPPCTQAATAPTCTPKPPPENSNLGFPPNQLKNTVNSSSSWPAQIRSTLVLCVLVSTFLLAMDDH